MTALLWWLTYRVNDDIVVFIQPAHSCIAARMRAVIAGVDGEFQEGHLLDDKTATKVLTNCIGRPLTRKEAQRLLEKIE